ncbi:hypothetical protein [Nitrospira tepida]|uniref:hypothetical protein n=1 Tax=Nitrospira tepida TaxID=2973512 RepID=UPI00259C8BA4|nr:hypothetical protein [Nitrospira tepida]
MRPALAGRSYIIVIAVTMALSLAPWPDAAADVTVFRGQDGTSGTITDLGSGTGLYSDPHGTFGPVQERGDSPSTLTLPPGQPAQGAKTPFGMPLPPSNLTPAPVLPFQPHAPLMPGPGSSTPSVPFAPGVNPGGPGGSFRGR